MEQQEDYSGLPTGSSDVSDPLVKCQYLIDPFSLMVVFTSTPGWTSLSLFIVGVTHLLHVSITLGGGYFVVSMVKEGALVHALFLFASARSFLSFGPQLGPV